MYSEIRTVLDPKLRVQIAEERTLFDSDPQVWLDKYKEKQEELTGKIVAAKNLLPEVSISYDLIKNCRSL